ncbi:hypothetical protein F5Y14DRAFT_397612 [Nemania sp. NC0429]|nr:hypothetical protein F5Y14DRAFT_397612 [Nemania sp. NC0429]
MPALTLNTEAAASRASQQPSSNRGSQGAGNPPTRPLQSTTPIPVPVPMPYASREQPQPQPHPHPHPQSQPQPSPRSTSPARPTYSPITPPPNATAFPPRPTYTHSTHVDARAAPAPALAPAPEPIDFDSNPDVLAIRSAISILQMQRRKAERDMAALDRVKSAALAEPEAFVRDLTAGRVRVEGERLFVGGVRAGEEGDKSRSTSSRSSDDSDSDSDSESDESRGDETMKDAEPNALLYSQPLSQGHAGETSNTASHPGATIPGPLPWASIPKPQNVIRCPPINWSQYAVVGESLDKLHDEQVRSPAQGTPAVLTPEGRFEFKAGGSGGVGKQERYIGVAAPYAPGKDKIDRKSKIPPRR